MPAGVHAFTSSLAELERFRSVVSEFISSDLNEIEKNRVILALDEAFVNIITHGYAEAQNGSIELAMEKTRDAIVFILMDRAPLFDPTTAVSPDLSEHGASGKSHGLGIHLYSTIMKAAHSARPDGGNILKLSWAVS